MRRSLLPVLVLVLAGLPATAVTAQAIGGDCEDSPDGCGGGGGPTPKPSIPTGIGTVGSYHVYVDPYGDDRDGYVSNGQTTYFGGGPYHDIGGDGVVRDGFAGSSVTLATTINPEATATVTAAADANLSAEAGIGVLYAVELHAVNAAAFAALVPLLNISGAIAHISGSYTLTTTGQAYAQAYAETGINANIASALQAGAGATCDRSGYFDSTGAGCGTFSYTADLNFATGSSFIDGNPLSLYGTIDINATVHAGATGLGGTAGNGSAFIDPTIALNPLFNSPSYTLNIGNAVIPVAPGAVPEPAAWALMLAGFAAVGGAARRSRTRVVAA